MVQLEESVFSETDDLLAHDNWLISRFEGNPPGTVRRAAAGVGAQHSEEPCAACATGDSRGSWPTDSDCASGPCGWFNARFIHSVTELLETDYKLALCAMGGFMVRNFIRVIVLILVPVTCIEQVRPQLLSRLHRIIVGG